MAAVFCDAMTDVRQRIYWDVSRNVYTLEEWEAVCSLAVTRETFHKVPLPAVLRGYLTEVRQAAAYTARLVAIDAEVRLAQQTPAYNPLLKAERAVPCIPATPPSGEPVAPLAPPQPARNAAFIRPLTAEELVARRAMLLAQARQVAEEDPDGQPIH